MSQLDTLVMKADEEKLNLHFQSTGIVQGHGRFASSYAGQNSLSPKPEIRPSLTSTLFIGGRLWLGGEIYINPELTGGYGLSGALGIAGFPNGEIYRIGYPKPVIFIARLFIRQTFGLGGPREFVEHDANQLAGNRHVSRITVTIGKFSVIDLFGDNAYSHDPRTQFMNWALMAHGAWDYPADTRGYTWGIIVDYNQHSWALRASIVMVPTYANGPVLDTRVNKAHAEALELESRYLLFQHPGKLRLLAFANTANMGTYRTTINTSSYGMDITKSRWDGTVKYGLGINTEQELTKDLGAFTRFSWNDGKTETWAFTEIDRSFSLGLLAKGRSWKRPDDNLGLAILVNGLSKDHADYLTAGGYGFIIGDGALNYALEKITEAYYLFEVIEGVSLTADYQWVTNPAYNRDRGPVSIWTLRLHYEF